MTSFCDYYNFGVRFSTKVKETETETALLLYSGLLYCFRRGKKTSLNDKDHFGFEEVRFKLNLRKRKQHMYF